MTGKCKKGAHTKSLSENSFYLRVLSRGGGFSRELQYLCHACIEQVLGGVHGELRVLGASYGKDTPVNAAISPALQRSRSRRVTPTGCQTAFELGFMRRASLRGWSC